MAITQVGVPEKKKESAWDTISKVMGFATSALDIANGVKKLTSEPPKKAPDPAVGPDLPETTLTPDPLDAAKDPMQGNSMYRRFMMGQRVT